jgi:hypothetical protein
MILTRVQLKRIIVESLSESTELAMGSSIAQSAGDSVGGFLSDKLRGKISNPAFSIAMNIGNHPTWQSWLAAQPRELTGDAVQGSVMKKVFAATRATPALIGVAMALSVPYLTNWQFKKMGTPKEKLKDLYIRHNRRCLYKGHLGGIKQRDNCEPIPLTTDNFREDDINMIKAIPGGGELTVREQIFTGEPGPLTAYVLMFVETGGINELHEAKKDGWIDNEVFNLVNQAGQKLRKDKVRAYVDLEKIRLAIIEAERRGIQIFPDTPQEEIIRRATSTT